MFGTDAIFQYLSNLHVVNLIIDRWCETKIFYVDNILYRFNTNSFVKPFYSERT